jgi:D-psicose/D-tagatose/L-ribulose 3-epimerase
MPFKYSITLSSFRNIEPIERTIETLADQGYNAVEMYGEPEKVNLKILLDVFNSFDLSVCGITGMWGSTSLEGRKRKLLSADAGLVTNSQKYVQRCIDMCRSLEANELNVCLFADDRSAFDPNHHVIPEPQKATVLRGIIPMLSELSRFAGDRGIRLLLEPLNRYSTPYLTTAEEAVAVARQVNQENFGVLLDTFHMNIEEDSFENAILKSERLLHHTHFADNNRKMPGRGHIDFHSIIESLRKIGYQQYISFEPHLTSTQDYKMATKCGLDFIKSIY